MFHTYLIEKTVVDNVLNNPEWKDEWKKKLKGEIIQTILGPRAKATDIPNSIFINKSTHTTLYNTFITAYNKLPRDDVYNNGKNATGLFLPTGTFQTEKSKGGSHRTRTSRKKPRRNIKRRYVSH
jgi:hypothetical protein